MPRRAKTGAPKKGGHAQKKCVLALGALNTKNGQPEPEGMAPEPFARGLAEPLELGAHAAAGENTVPAASG